MEEKERIAEKIRERAGSEEQLSRCLELLEAVYAGAQQGLTGGAAGQAKARLDAGVRELEQAASAVERLIKG